MEIKPIRSDSDYEAALKEIERLWGSEPGTLEGDRFEVLFALVEAYENQHYDILPPDPVEAIKYYMESRGLERKDLEPFIGGSGRVSEVLNHKRSLSLSMIRKLHKGLGIPAESLISVSSHRQI
jgi:HTH-type transcriptional regulator/antitoxin HigA